MIKLFRYYCCCFCISLFVKCVYGIPVALLYDHNIREAIKLPREDDISSSEIKLKVPIIFFGVPFDTIFVNSNGLLSFQTEIPNFFNIQFPLSYPVISPFYANIDIKTGGGTISYYESDSPSLLQRASNDVKDAFSKHHSFQATSLFVVTWFEVGYYKEGHDKINTFQVVLFTDGIVSFAEFLYPENGIQWIQGTGDESGLPDARAQAGFISPNGKVFSLPGSGTEQVRNLEGWSNMNLNGQFIYQIYSFDNIIEPDLNNDRINKGQPVSCADAPITFCHVQATCTDYENGICCKCKQNYYGNGKFCVKKDVPLRVNGKVNGQINGETLDNLDLQSYIVMSDGRAYTAISKIPPSISFDVQSLQLLGGVIGYVFAKPIRDALNGYQLTGGVFNHTATIRFLNTSQTVVLRQKYLGLDVFDQLRLECEIDGAIPKLPTDSKVVIDAYDEQYTQTSPGVIQMTGTRILKYNDETPNHIIINIDQVFQFDHCQNYDNSTTTRSWKLKVARNFISYESREQIIRFGLSNNIEINDNDNNMKEIDQCEQQGRLVCGPNSICVADIENNSFRCICHTGYHQLLYATNQKQQQASCVDIDECQAGIHQCDLNAQCINTLGAYQCRCNTGFEGDGRSCQRSTSCQNIKCPDNNAECLELNGIATCQCLVGYTGSGQTCYEIDNNSNNNNSCNTIGNCSPNGMCFYDREINQYLCQCLPGYDGDGYNCQKQYDRDDDDDKNNETIITTTEVIDREIQRCLMGVCWCPGGYTLETDTSYCLPISTTTEQPDYVNNVDEDDNDDNYFFAPEVQCYNSSICFCPRGYHFEKINHTCILGINNKITTLLKTKGYSGINLISCNILNNCDKNAQCILGSDSDTQQNYSCICNQGYEGDGYNCQLEIVSCTQVNNCNSHATCTYDRSLGKSKCVCNQGYDGDGLHCKITAICTSNQDCITDTEECLYTNWQRYECVCKDGYTRDSQNQCVKLSGTCGGGVCVENAECLYDNQYQTYYCTCKSGYLGDGITECKLKPVGCNVLNNCGLLATCTYDQFTTLYQCQCDEGFYGDGFVCYTEINCHIDPNLCDLQHATCVTDANRRYICQCNNGFVGNGSVCVQNQRHDGNFLLLNQGMATLRIPFDKPNQGSSSNNNNNQGLQGKPIQIKYFQTAVGLDIDCVEGRLFWSDVSGMAIRSANYNGSGKSDFITAGIGSPEGLSVDWISRNIYWTDATKDTIEVASLGPNSRRRILFDTDLINPRGIVVHPQRGKIFWSDWDRRHPKIEWANADGTGREIFLEGIDLVSLPNSLTIDYETEQLCYADAGTKKIECIDIDSREKHTIAINCTYPFGIAITDKHIYWSDWISKKIERVEKFSLIRLEPLDVPLGGSGNKLFGLIAVPKSCPSLTNVCQYYKDQCPNEHICLPNGAGSRRCVCTFQADNLLDKPKCTL